MCFASYLVLETLDESLNQNCCHLFQEVCVKQELKKDLVKDFQSKRGYIRICKILAIDSKHLALGTLTRELESKNMRELIQNSKCS